MHRNRLLNLYKANANRGEFRADASTNTIYLYDVIVSSKAEADWFGGVDAETFAQTLTSMTGDVAIRINSPGGDVFAARAMSQAIREHPGAVTAYVDGYAASAASFITSVADKTIMAPGAMLMIHKAWSIAMGNSDDMLALADLLDKIDGTIAETYAAAAVRREGGTDAATFMDMMAAETWLTGAEAVDLGLADEVAADAPKASARWDLSAYDKPPANESEIDPAPAAEKPTERPRPDIAADMLFRPAA